jgi:uncharacterized membrane protein (GlpM family)
MWERYLLYFLVGGAVVALTTYFGSQGKGWLAAFIAMFPALTVITFISIYFEGGGGTPLKDYIKGIFLVLPGWLCYLLTIFYFTDKVGLYSILFGTLVYVTITVAFRLMML